MMKSKQLIKLIKDQLDGKLISEFALLKPKACSYSMDDGDENKKAKGIKSVSSNKNFEDFKHCLEAT